MPSKHFDLDTNALLGGENTSDVTIASQKAVKTYVDSALEEKQPTITGAISSVTDNDLNSNLVIVSDNSGKITESNITTIELGYLESATSNIQNQINNKANSEHVQASNTINSLTEYEKGTITGALDSSDTLNTALAKIENNIDSKADISDVTLVTIRDWTV